MFWLCFDAPKLLGAVTEQSFSAPQSWANELTDNRGWRVEKHPRMLAEINGDNQKDVVGFGDDGVWVATSTGAIFSPAFVLADFGYNQGWRVDKHVRMMGDINADRMEDIVGFFDDGVHFALSDGSGFAKSSFVLANFGYNQGWRVDKHVRLLGNVNIDGRKDIVGFFDDGVWLSLASPPPRLPSPLYKPSLFGPPAFVLANFGYNQAWRVDKHVRLLADVNGDGLQDIVAFGDDGVWTALSTGSGFGPAQFVLPSFGYNQGWRVDKHVRLLADVNRDGLADIVAFGDDGVWTALATGSGFFGPAQFVLKGFGFNQGWRVGTIGYDDDTPRFVADLNGDGYLDIVGYGPDAIWRALGGPAGFEAPRPVLRGLVDWTVPNQALYETYRPRFVGDINNDGTADLVAFGPYDIKVARSSDVPPPSPPAAPSNPRITGQTSSTLSIAWNDNSSDERRFFVTYSGGQNPGTVDLVGANHTTDVLYGAPNTQYCFTVQAENLWGISAKTPSVCGRTNAPPLTITTSSALPNGTLTYAYYQTLAASGGIPPYAWSVSSGSLPNGLTLNSSGVLSGTPLSSGKFNFTVKVRDSQPTPVSTSQAFSLTINGGYSSVNVLNCYTDTGTVYIWTQDLSNGLWKDWGAAPAAWNNSSGCQLSATPVVVTLENAHRYKLVSVDPGNGCGMNDPLYCTRGEYGPLIGDTKGPATLFDFQE